MHYQIRVKGHLDPSWQQWFRGLQITLEPGGTTCLSGLLPDQAALYGVLLKINRLGLTLLTVAGSKAEAATQYTLEGERTMSTNQAYATRVNPAANGAPGSYASVNGLDLYYEVHGSGPPLVLLHGGLATIDLMFGPVLPTLAATRQVIAIELQAHGHTADIDRPLRFEQMADDVAALLQHLALTGADILGYSLGGGVALQTAIRHPHLVRRLVLVSTVFKREGWYPEVLAGMAAMTAEAADAMTATPMYGAYAAAAPRPADWPVLIDKLGQLLAQDYDWTEDVRALAMPTLIMVGDADSVRLAHTVEMFGLLGGGQADGGMGGQPNAQFAVLPGTLHWNILFRTDLLLPAVTPFLNAQ